MSHSPAVPMTTVREVVGLLGTRAAFEATVAELMASGFEHADLSVLSSHESIDAAGEPGRSWRDALVGLVGELRYEGPLVASGAIILAGGPAAVAIASVIGAAVGGVAIKELVDDVTATPHTEAFARALEAGNIALWVRVEDAAAEGRALAILKSHDADNLHVNETTRPAA